MVCKKSRQRVEQMLLDKVFGLSHLSVHFMFPFQLMRYNRPFFRPVASNATLHWCCTRFKENFFFVDSICSFAFDWQCRHSRYHSGYRLPGLNFLILLRLDPIWFWILHCFSPLGLGWGTLRFVSFPSLAPCSMA